MGVHPASGFDDWGFGDFQSLKTTPGEHPKQPIEPPDLAEESARATEVLQGKTAILGSKPTKGDQVINSLRHFRKVTECSGYPPMMYESLDMAIAYATEKDLLLILELLGVTPRIHSSMPPQPEPGKSYDFQEYSKFPKLVAGHLVEQPGHCELFSVPVYIFCKGGVITVSIDPTGGDITDAHVVGARVIEARMTSLMQGVNSSILRLL